MKQAKCWPFMALLASLISLNSYATSRQLNFVETSRLTTNLQQDDFYQVASVEIEQVEGPAQGPLALNQPFGVGRELGELLTIIEGMQAIGEKVWPLVKAGEPVVNVNLTPLSVLPTQVKDLDTFYQMEGWSDPESLHYKVTYKNLYGMTVVEFTYGVHFQYGGKHEDSGRYLTNVQLTPVEVYVMWGFNFEASSKLVGITNVGTREAPVAAATVQLNYKSSTVFTESQSSYNYYFTGEGKLLALDD